MKRIILIMLALCLMLTVLPACAETVAEQVSAPATVQDTLTSNIGKTTIAIDVRVTVPDVENMYLIPVTGIAFDDDLVPILAELTWPGLGKKKIKIEEGNNTVSVEGRMMGTFWRHSATIDRYATKKDDTHIQNGNYYLRRPDMDGVYECSLASSIQYDTRYRLKQTINCDNLYMEEEVTGEGIEGHPLTSTQAIDICETFIKGLMDKLSFALTPVWNFYGALEDSPFADAWQPLLTINATDGTVVDLKYGY